MEFVINKIISIDRDAESYRENINELLRERQKDSEKILEIMREQWEEESKVLKESIMKEKLSEAEVKVKGIKKETDRDISLINSKYEKNKNEIINDIFNEIVKSI